MLLFNRYEYQPSTDLIGEGEQTRVYRALDKQIYLPVAVKIYHGNFPGEKSGSMQPKTLMSLDHPNISRYLQIRETELESRLGERERTIVCVMELLEDGDFVTYYRARRQPELLRRMLSDILNGLAYLHSRGIVHGRLKPSNLLVGETTEGPVVKITDFGFGSDKPVLRDACLSSSAEGTHVAYERFNAHAYSSNKKDFYHPDFRALGLAVYEALTGNDVFFKDRSGESREQMIRQILSPAKISRLPAPFDSFVAHCLARHADNRAQNTRELLVLLAQPIMSKDDVYHTVVLPAMMGEDAEDEAEDVPVAEGLAKDVKIEDEVAEHASIKDELAEDIPVENGMAEHRTAQDSAVVVGMAEDTAVAKAQAEAIVVKMRKDEDHSLFNRYEYDPRAGLIGKGGFSRVYKAFDKKLDGWVALKFLTTWKFSDRHSRIARMSRVMGLDHPNICRYLDIEEIEKENAFGEKETLQICVMELLNGGNLFDYYTAHPAQEVLKKLLTDALLGLDYLHKNGIIHNNIKPSNILIGETNNGVVAKIADFGAGRLPDESSNQGTTALVVSIPHMAPEQLDVKKYGMNEKISYNLDFWALGVTIYEVITGKALFMNRDNDSSEQIMTNIMAPGLPDKINQLPQPFLDIVRCCVVKDARHRVQRAGELIGLLRGEAGPKPYVSEPKPYVSEPKPYMSGPKPVVEGPNPEVEGPKPEMLEPISQVLEPKPGMVEPKPQIPEPQIPEPKAGIVLPTASWVKKEVNRSTPEKPKTMNMNRVGMTSAYNRWAGWAAGHGIAVTAVMVVLLAIALYIYKNNRRLDEALGFFSRNADPAQIISHEPAASRPVPAANHSPARGQQAHAGKTTGTAVSTADGPGGGLRGANGEDGLAGTEEKALAKYVMLLSTPTTCSIDINNASYGVLESGKTMKVYLVPGNYILRATSRGHPSTVYTQRLVVNRKDLNHSKRYKVQL